MSDPLSPDQKKLRDRLKKEAGISAVDLVSPGMVLGLGTGSTTRFALIEIAATVDVHPAHLARTFRRFQRQTVGDYLRQLRLEFARARLSASAEPISEIALSAGFYDQCHFSRAFKRHTGMTPAEYRAAFHLRDDFVAAQRRRYRCSA